MANVSFSFAEELISQMLDIGGATNSGITINGVNLQPTSLTDSTLPEFNCLANYSKLSDLNSTFNGPSLGVFVALVPFVKTQMGEIKTTPSVANAKRNQAGNGSVVVGQEGTLTPDVGAWFRYYKTAKKVVALLEKTFKPSLTKTRVDGVRLNFSAQVSTNDVTEITLQEYISEVAEPLSPGGFLVAVVGNIAGYKLNKAQKIFPHTLNVGTYSLYAIPLAVDQGLYAQNEQRNFAYLEAQMAALAVESTKDQVVKTVHSAQIMSSVPEVEPIQEKQLVTSIPTSSSEFEEANVSSLDGLDL